MPTISEVIKFEKSTPERIIRLIKSGDFLRAYNHSAWLFYEKIAKHKVMCMHLKSLDTDLLYVSFPDIACSATSAIVVRPRLIMTSPS